MRILIVDDSPSTRALIAGTVESRLSCTILEAGNGLEALAVLAVEPCDLVIADVNMPALGGLDLLEYVRAHAVHGRVPFVLITTERDARTRRQGEENGASAYLTKPFEPGELVRVLEDLLADPAPGQP
jgi:two-component system chemotaxis response regulator CheY